MASPIISFHKILQTSRVGSADAGWPITLQHLYDNATRGVSVSRCGRIVQIDFHTREPTSTGADGASGCVWVCSIEQFRGPVFCRQIDFSASCFQRK